MNDVLDYLDQWLNLIDGSASYLPYDIIVRERGLAEVRVAVAGFTRGELDVSVRRDRLVISGRHEPDNVDVEAPYPRYLHRGIAKRKFELAFAMNSAEVIEAGLDDGILTVLIAEKDSSSDARHIDIS